VRIIHIININRLDYRSRRTSSRVFLYTIYPMYTEIPATGLTDLRLRKRYCDWRMLAHGISKYYNVKPFTG